MTQDMKPSDAAPLGWAKSTALILAISAGLFIVLEGLASLAIVAYTLIFSPVPFMEEERAHTEYDELLGWVHIPDLRVENMYGPGVYLETNAQRLRADREYTQEVPDDRVRIICSGDSFTLGHSVDNDHAWCKLLEELDPRLETLNMGQAAYGIDQAFLWYRRDGTAFDHDVQVFAFITSDFDRMRWDNFEGYPKPYLTVEGGELVVQNTPVPPGGATSIPRRMRLVAAVQRIRLVEFGEAVLRNLGWEWAPRAATPALTDDEIREAAAQVFEELKEINESKGSTLVLTYLPRTGDRDSRWSDPWRGFVEAEATRLGVEFVDLVEEFRTLTLDEGEQMFLRPYQPSHYDESGNRWVAEQLLERLQVHPEIRERLEELR